MEMLTGTDINRLVVEIPVRHGKSIYCSHLLPCWHMMVEPDKNVTVVSYGGNFATEWSSRNRDLVAEYCPQLFGRGLHPDFATRSHFRMAPPNIGEHRGLGIGGSLAGTGAHLLVADDLIKEFSEVATEEARERIYMRFHGELLNRLEPGGKILVVMSRRHPDDLSGRLLATNADLDPIERWHRITFPALSVDNEALWPERYPTKKLLGIKRDLELAGTPWIWSGLYQQDAASCSELTEWPASYWKEPFYYTELPAFSPAMRLMSLDPSMGKDRKRGDFAGLLFGLVDPGGTLWIDDPRLVRVPLDQLEDMSTAMYLHHLPQAFAIETNNFQELVAGNISRKCPQAPIYAYNQMRTAAKNAGAGKGKEVDIRMLLTPLLGSHNLRIRDTPQGRILGQQLRDFPLASHDDGPDSLALMVRLWRDLQYGPTTSGDVAILTR